MCFILLFNGRNQVINVSMEMILILNVFKVSLVPVDNWICLVFAAVVVSEQTIRR